MNDFSIINGRNQDIEPEELYFTSKEQADFIDNLGRPRCMSASDIVYAKIITRADGSSKYMIRLDRTGKLYNPSSIFGKGKEMLPTSFLDRVCRSQYKYKEVNLKAFDMYIKFLSTKNASWLYNTEREI